MEVQTKMSNDEKKADNDSVRAIASTFNTLNRLVREKETLNTTIPEVTLPAEYSDQSTPDVIEDEAFANQCEQVAALQFSGQKKEFICKTLEIELRDYKKIVLSQEFVDIKKRIAEDQKVNILSKILGQVDAAVIALAELMDTADEDRVRLNAAALVLEHASRLLEEQKSQFPNIQNVIRDAAQTGEPVIMNLAQVILNQRRERGLDK
jgi:hypothetical protein